MGKALALIAIFLVTFTAGYWLAAGIAAIIH